MKATVETAELRVLRSELLEAHRELGRLRTQNEQLMGSNRDLSSLLVTTDKRSGELVKIIVAFRRLLDSGDSPSALRSIEEILINVIGTEDFVVLLVTATEALRTVAGIGPCAEHIRRTAPTLDEVHAEAHRFVPLYIADKIVGAIAIGALLPHRDLLGATDDQVLLLLSRYAATVMMAADHRKDWKIVSLAEVA